MAREIEEHDDVDFRWRAWGMIGGRARLQLSLGLNSIRVKLAQTDPGRPRHPDLSSETHSHTKKESVSD